MDISTYYIYIPIIYILKVKNAQFKDILGYIFYKSISCIGIKTSNGNHRPRLRFKSVKLYWKLEPKLSVMFS